MRSDADALSTSHARDSGEQLRRGNQIVSAPERPERVQSVFATHDLFATLRVNPRLGRVFEEADGRPGAAQVAILSDGLWRSSFGGDEQIVGKAVEIDGLRRTVVGVMPPRFDVADQRVQVWLPLTVDRASAEFQLVNGIARDDGGQRLVAV